MTLTCNALQDILSPNKACILNQDGTINYVSLHKLAQKYDHHLVDLLASTANETMNTTHAATMKNAFHRIFTVYSHNDRGTTDE